MYWLPASMLNGFDWNYWEARARCGLTCDGFPENTSQEGYYAYKVLLANQNGILKDIHIPKKYEKYLLEKYPDQDIKETSVSAYVYRLTEFGMNVLTDDYKIIFIHRSNIKDQYRIGQVVQVDLLPKIKDDNYGLIKELTKDDIVNKNIQMIINELEKRNGILPLSRKSEALMIKHYFNLSKTEFKTALNKLLEEGRIIEKVDRVVLLYESIENLKKTK